MGTDYAQRKLAKKKWKKFAAEPSDGKKQRAKRNKTRRLCQGMCYGEPELKPEDKEWDKDDVSDDYDSEIEQLNEIKQENAVMPKVPEDPAKHAQDLPQKRPRMSTNVDLPAAINTEGAAGRASKKQKTLGVSDAPPTLSIYPVEIQRYMQAEGFSEPTEIQERCWPECLEGRDVRAVAEPGSGKTLGYLLPSLPWLVKRAHASNQSASGPGVLVLVPTRELAQQVAASCWNLKGLFNLQTACIFGGGDRSAQEASIKRKPDIVVATPGRLLDFTDAATLDLSSVGYLVLDEADKMLSLGLRPQLDRIRECVLAEQPDNRSTQRPQVLLFTATMPAEVEETAQQWQSNPVITRVSTSGASISRTVVQVVQVCAEHKKPKKLMKHLGQIKEAGKGARNPPRVLVFANRIKTVRFLHTTISAAGFKNAMLHGDRTQTEREEAMLDFRSGKAQVLVATDVAARGLHIRGLPYIINYDFPSRTEPYIHRVGRTGRLTSTGHAFSFFTRNLAPLARPLLALLQEHGQAVDPNLLLLADAYDTAMGKLGDAAADAWAPDAAAAAEDSDAQQETEHHAHRMSGGNQPASRDILSVRTGEENDAAERKESGEAASSRRGIGSKAVSMQKGTVPALALPGLYQKEKANVDPDLEGFSDSDAEVQEPKMLTAGAPSRKDVKAERSIKVQNKEASKEVPTGRELANGKQPGAKKRRALPGRLRKKLAKRGSPESHLLVTNESLEV